MWFQEGHATLPTHPQSVLCYFEEELNVEPWSKVEEAFPKGEAAVSWAEVHWSQRVWSALWPLVPYSWVTGSLWSGRGWPGGQRAGRAGSLKLHGQVQTLSWAAQELWEGFKAGK